MFVIRNTKRDYKCYLSENNKWEGLLKAKTFETKEDAEKEKYTETAEILNWNDVVGLNKN